MGLRLYERPAADFVLEALLVLIGWWLLRKQPSAPRWATGRMALAALLVLQLSTDIVGSLRSGMKPSACAEAGARSN